ncbi:unnamed protein product [Sphagnum troendelagicum]|uniref:Uncharacterized protein n=1 Tax=Sphagnum troendelagicum TaxID=128251 RepID=A0ABP0UYN9_9BRYO
MSGISSSLYCGILESFLGTTAELFLLQEKILTFAAMFTESFLSMKALPKENSNRRRFLRRGSGFSDQSASLPPPPANSCSRSTIFFFFFTAPAPNPQIFAVANVEISADTKCPISARLYPEIL